MYTEKWLTRCLRSAKGADARRVGELRVSFGREDGFVRIEVRARGEGLRRQRQSNLADKSKLLRDRS